MAPLTVFCRYNFHLLWQSNKYYINIKSIIPAIADSKFSAAHCNKIVQTRAAGQKQAKNQAISL
jgi:hypothetical protein